MFRDLEPGTRRALTPYRAAIEAGRATGKYDGVVENVGTPAQLGELDARLRTAG
jgi:MurNAc alpha-1-phosphate uridylyltransferase